MNLSKLGFASLSFVVFLSAQTIPSDSLKAYYAFTGNANDLSGNGHNGSVSGPSLTTDRYGNTNSAYQFTGIDGVTEDHRIDIGVASTIVPEGSDLTYVSWIKSSGMTGVHTVVNTETGTVKGFGLWYDPGVGGVFTAFISDGTFPELRIDTSLVPTGEWNFVAMTWSSVDSLRLYINGALEGTAYKSQWTYGIDYVPHIFIGGAHLGETGGQNSFNGTLDDIRIYNRALSAAEITALYLEGPPLAPTNLTATAGDQQIVLTWSPNAEGDFLKYYVYGGTTTAPTTLVDSTAGGNLNDTTATITGVSGDSTYYYRITAADSAGNESAYSSEASATVPLFFVQADGFTGGGHGEIIPGDYDDDGDLDILFVGSTGGSPTNAIVRLYRNDNPGFTVVAHNITPVHASAADWGDFDGDGDLDLLISGQNSSSSTITRVYRNDSGVFTDINAGLFGIFLGDVDWGDFDNDGDLDIALIGPDITLLGYKALIYRNDGGLFTDIGAGLSGRIYSTIDWVDYDNDSDLDIFLSGFDGSAISKIYRNDSGIFTDIAANITGVYQGSADWNDYDSDGDLDLLLTGRPSGQGTTYIYENNAGVFSRSDSSFHNVYLSDAAWGDVDNDGDLDAFVIGWDATAAESTAVYINNAGTYAKDTVSSFLNMTIGDGTWFDYDGDNDLDLLLTGVPSGARTKLYRNNIGIANTTASAPTGLSSTVSADTVDLSWGTTTDSQTPSLALSYNLRVGTTSGGNQTVPSHSSSTGFRKIVALGNAFQDSSWSLINLADGTYYWSVQAIDGAFAGGAWSSEATFTIAVPPDAPGNLAVTAGDAQIDLTWSASNEGDFLRYLIYGGTATAPTTLVDSTTDGNPSDTTASITGLSNGTTYYIRITAVDSSGNESAYSNEVNETPQTLIYADSLALVALYNSTNGGSWTNKTNWLTSASLSTWNGVTVSGGRVNQLNLITNNLAGPIPAEIGNLTGLVTLYLQNNQLTGVIPDTIGNFANMTQLYLYNNQLTGAIPATIGNLSSLQYLYLYDNLLTGAIPDTIGNLTNMIRLQLYNNQLTGAIPATIGNLTNMTQLYLYSNQLSGAIPAAIGSLTSLTQLRLQFNQLTGAVPDSISNLTLLQYMYIFDNQLVDLPSLIGNSSLLELHVQNNRFTFEDLEPNISVASSVFNYTPQDSVGSEKDTTVALGDPFTVSVTVGGSSNVYQWSKDGTDISGATNDTLDISSIAFADSGSYTLRTTNTVATVLTLYSRPVTVTVEDLPPAAPTGLVATAGTESATLTWDSVANSDLADYYLYRHTANDSTLASAIDTIDTPDTTALDLTVSGGVDYWYWVSAVDSAGNESALSAGASVTPYTLFEADSLALVALYDSTGGASWTNTWTLTDPVNTWFGVTVSSGRVTVVALPNNFLNGPLPSEIGSLTNLTQLFLPNNQLDGPIPTEIGNLINLQSIYLYNNGFTGAIPPTIGNLTNLLILSLYGNNLTGAIPTAIGNLSSLTQLLLSNNQLTGSIPVEIGNLTGLTELDLRGNQLTGAIPASLGNLTNLIQLRLFDNQLSGPIPIEIGNLTNLTGLHLYINQLTGAIPTEIGNLTNLTQLFLFSNQLTGPIPATIGNLTNLQFLSLYGNQLTGAIPDTIGNLTNLTQLLLNNNQLTGAIPDSIVNLTKLQFMYLYDNQLVDLPSLGAISTLVELVIQNNRFTFEDIEPNIGVASATFTYAPQDSVGIEQDTAVTLGDPFTLEVVVGGASNLYQWRKNDVPISGATSSSYTVAVADSATHSGAYTATITNTVATALTLYSRPITVTVGDQPPAIPAGLIAIAGTESVSLSWNSVAATDLAGYHLYRHTANDSTVASAIDTIDTPDTTALDLTVSGGVDYWYWVSAVDVAGNESVLSAGVSVTPYTPLQADSLALVDFYNSTNGASWTASTNWLTSASLSTWYGVTVSGGRVTQLYLNGNNLAGPIPAAIGNLTSLTLLYLNNNLLTGVIPDEIGDLSGLTQLWLNSNQLTGAIPAVIGNLANLNDLLLNSNQLTGAIPDEIGDLSGLKQLWLYSNQLSGAIPDSIGNLTNLITLYLNHNQLTGSIPATIGNLTSITQLRLFSNQLTGPIPSEIGNLTSLTALKLHSNQLTGSIPPEIGNLTGLTTLWLHINQLTGAIPDSIGNLTSMTQLYLNNNQLTGVIPDSIVNLTQLQFMYLYDNQLVDLPDLSPISTFIQLKIETNRFTFEDIEPNINVASTTFTYAPQDSVGSEIDTTVALGDRFTVSVIVGGSNNQYQWRKNGVPISGATSSSYTVAVADSATHSGVYTAVITNTVATSLTLYSRPITVTVGDLPPAIPTGLTAISSDQQIDLHWNPNAEGDFLMYYIYGGTTSGSTTVIDSSAGGDLNDTTSTITGLSNGATYFYRITAVDTSGNESAYSNEVNETPFNTAPVLTSPATAAATEDTPFVYHASATDVDGTALTYIYDLSPSWAAAAGDSIYGTPLEGDLDTTFRLIASDGELTDTLVVAVTVTPVNDAPVITSASVTAAAIEDNYFVYLATASDPEDSTVTFAFDLSPSWTSAAGDSIYGTPLEGDLDTTFRLIASDGDLTDTLVVAVTVTPVNDAPVITSSSLTGATEDTPYYYRGTASDAEDSTLVWAFDRLPSWLLSNADSVIGTPLEGTVDTSFRAIVFDGELRDTLSVGITFSPINDAPVITSAGTATATEDIYFVYRATATDAEDSTLVWTIDQLPGWLAANADSISGTPLEGDLDTTFRIIASDGELTDTLVVALNVTLVNDAPVILSPGSVIAGEDGFFIYRALATDPEDSTVVFFFDQTPTWLTAAGDSIFGGVPEGAADTSFRVIASDGELADTVVVIVDVVPSLPRIEIAVLSLDFSTVRQDSSRILSLTVSNSGADTLTISSRLVADSPFDAIVTGAIIFPGENSAIEVTFIPTEAIDYADTLWVDHNDPDTTSLYVVLLGSGVKPTVSLDDQPMAFGDVLVGETISLSRTLYNAGNDTLLAYFYQFLVPPYTLAGPAVMEFLPIPPGDSISFTVQAMLTDQSMRYDTLAIFTNDPDLEWAYIPISATGTAPEFGLPRTAVALVTQAGNELTFAVPVRNSGTYPFDYEVSIHAFWVNFDWLTVSRLSGTVAPFAEDTLIVSTTGTAALGDRDYRGSIVVSSHASEYPDSHPVTDSVRVNLTILPDDAIAQSDIVIPGGDPPAMTMVSDSGDSLGLVIDFELSDGGTVSAIAADIAPPRDESTVVIDPAGEVTNPVYANFYWEIIANISSSFLANIEFDYRALTGVSNPRKLRLARRPSFSGSAVAWDLLPFSEVLVDSLTLTLIAQNQGAFSQWTIVSDSADNPFADVLPPAITVAAPGSQTATSGVALTIAAEVTDESQISAVTLNYYVGGRAQLASVDMTLTTGSSYEAEIPAVDVTPPGLAYFVAAADNLSNSALTDTISVAVSFPANAISSAGSGSFFASGFPIEKWRLIGLPGDLDSRTLQATIQDELGGAPSNETWKIFKYDGSGLESYSEATALQMGQSYWMKQLVAADVAFSLGSGKSVDLAGYDISLAAGTWNLIASPYPFEVGFEPDDAIHYGPFTYGPFGSSGQEGWSLGSSTLTLKPWGGYIIFNKSSVAELLALRPLALPESIAKTTAPQGWTLTFTAEGANYVDFGNVIGRIAGASEGLDRHDQPELPFVEGYLSMTMENELWNGTDGPMTTDLRGDDLVNGLWNLAIRSQDEQSPITLRYRLDSSAKDGLIRVLVDQVTREQHVLGEAGEIVLPRYTEAFPRRLNVVVGDEQFVASAVEEILSGLPEAFALAQNYPNPFNPNTTLRYALPHPARGSLKVYNLLGQEVVTLIQGWLDMGHHEIVWDGRDGAGRNLASGIYFAVFAADGNILTSKMALLK